MALLRRLAFLTAIAASGLGQGPACSGADDGLDTGCCNLVPASAVQGIAFPTVTMAAESAVMAACLTLSGSATTVQVSLAAPVFVFPDYAVITVAIAYPAPGGESITGTLVAKYSRTWLDGAPGQRQVWRFLVNGDLACSGPVSTNGCTSRVPPCFLLLGLVHFDGHVDYACNPAVPGTMTASMSLTHHVGPLSHAAASCAPLAATNAYSHRSSSYHVVGPSPFTFGTGVAPQGPLLGDSVRASHIGAMPGVTYQCRAEEKVMAGGALLTVGTGACGFLGPGPCGGLFACNLDAECISHQSLVGFTCCVTPNPIFFTVPLAGTPIASAGLLAFTLGTWGPQATYPWSGTTLNAYLGVVGYVDTCGQSATPLHVVSGVATAGAAGTAISSTISCAPPATPSVFLDLGNVLPLQLGFATTGYGRLSASDLVFGLSLP